MGLCRVGSPVTLSIRCIVVSETLIYDRVCYVVFVF